MPNRLANERRMRVINHQKTQRIWPVVFTTTRCSRNRCPLDVEITEERAPLPPLGAQTGRLFQVFYSGWEPAMIAAVCDEIINGRRRISAGNLATRVQAPKATWMSTIACELRSVLKDPLVIEVKWEWPLAKWWCHNNDTFSQPSECIINTCH
jgi:hypothetical protein